jgi:hypothetical protein
MGTKLPTAFGIVLGRAEKKIMLVHGWIKGSWGVMDSSKAVHRGLKGGSKFKGNIIPLSPPFRVAIKNGYMNPSFPRHCFFLLPCPALSQNWL